VRLQTKKSGILSAIFDDLDEAFVARLREISSYTRTTSDGKATITFKTARIEAAYTPEIIKKIEPGRLVAIPNVLGIDSNDNYSVYEIADVYPMHYSMLTLDRSQPQAIRKEFMAMIEEEWKKDSKNTWIEIIAAQTGYIIKIDTSKSNSNNNDNNDGNIDDIFSRNNQNLKFVRKNTSVLTGSQVHLLSKKMIQKFICYTPLDDKGIENFTIGSLLGVTEKQIPFTVNLEKLIHYHVGVFAFTGSGKSNLTSLVIKKAAKAVPDLKFVIFDISSEYGINILDLLRSAQARVILTEPLRGNNTEELAEDYMRRHVYPESLEGEKQHILSSIGDVIKTHKIRVLSTPPEEGQNVSRYATYGGLLQSIGELTEDRYGAPTRILIPGILDVVRDFMRENRLDENSQIDANTMQLIRSVNDNYIENNRVKLSAGSLIRAIFANLQVRVEHIIRRQQQQHDSSLTTDISNNDNDDDNNSTTINYDASTLVDEIMDTNDNSPKVFVINLPEADIIARTFCADIIDRVFRRRRGSFTLDPRVVFVFDEAQEFIPSDKKREDGTDASSRAVERLLRHGRKYHLHGWISTQRVA
jgi:uncharacterized protein